MESISDLSKQQTKVAGWMPKVILSLVGSLPLRALYNKKEYSKGMFLCHREELKWFLALFSLISSKADEQLKPPCVLGFQTAWSGNCWRGEKTVASMLERWLAGACSNSLLKLHLPSSQKSAILELLSLLSPEVRCANGPLPSQLSHQNEQFPVCSFH